MDILVARAKYSARVAEKIAKYILTQKRKLQKAERLERQLPRNTRRLAFFNGREATNRKRQVKDVKTEKRERTR